MSETSYWFDKIGIAGILGGPAEAAIRLAQAGSYTGTEQIDEGVGILTGGLAAWNAAKYTREHEQGINRSPLVHLGRAMEVAGTLYTEIELQRGSLNNVFRAFLPAALAVTVGPICEFVLGPIHEKYSSVYKNQSGDVSA